MKNQNETKPRGMRQLYALGEKRSIDLSLSENPLGCSALVGKRLKQGGFEFNDYPKPNGKRLKEVIADKLNCLSDSIFINNGSEAIISVIPKVLACSGDEVIVPILTFPMFAICSELSGLKVRLAPMNDELGIDLPAIKKLIKAETKIIFLCNPNNPTGSVIARDELITFLQQVPKSVLTVVDEANIEFGGESVVELTSRLPNLMVLRTLSKGYGLANLRIGFAIANKRIINKLEEETPIFPVAGLSEELGMVALQDDNFILQTKEFIDQERQRIKKALCRFGFRVFPSNANNLFVKLPSTLNKDVFWGAIERAEISLVKGSSFAGFDDTFFRVSPRMREVNDKFLAAVGEMTEKKYF